LAFSASQNLVRYFQTFQGHSVRKIFLKMTQFQANLSHLWPVDLENQTLKNWPLTHGATFFPSPKETSTNHSKKKNNDKHPNQQQQQHRGIQQPFNNYPLHQKKQAYISGSLATIVL